MHQTMKFANDTDGFRNFVANNINMTLPAQCIINTDSKKTCG